MATEQENSKLDNPLKFLLNFRVWVLLILTGIFIILVVKEHFSFEADPKHIPTFLPYYILFVLYFLVYEQFESLSFQTSYYSIVHETKKYSRNFFIVTQIISVVLAVIAISFIYKDVSKLLIVSLTNFKIAFGSNQFLYSTLTSLTSIFFIFSSICLIFPSGILKSNDSLEKIGTLLIIVIAGFFVQTYFQHSFLDNFPSYLSNLKDEMTKYTIIFATISLILLILNFAKLFINHQKNTHAIEKLKNESETDFVKRIDYSKKYYRVSDFDKYGLAMTRINKEVEGREKDFYGIINRFGNEILPPKYHFRNYSEIPYYKNFKLIIANELETGKTGVIDIYGNWIIELDKQSIHFPNRTNPSNETWESHEKYVSIDNSALLDVTDMVIVAQDYENEITKNTEQGSITEYDGYYLNKQFERVKMKIVRVMIID